MEVYNSLENYQRALTAPVPVERLARRARLVLVVVVVVVLVLVLLPVDAPPLDEPLLVLGLAEGVVVSGDVLGLAEGVVVSGDVLGLAEGVVASGDVLGL